MHRPRHHASRFQIRVAALDAAMSWLFSRSGGEELLEVVHFDEPPVCDHARAEATQPRRTREIFGRET